MRIDEVLRHSLALRMNGEFAQAQNFVSNTLSSNQIYAPLIWQHDLNFWSDMQAGNCLLSRRRGRDAEFVRDIFSVNGFHRSFHRNANPLPKEQALLEQILETEMKSLLSESGSIHWVIKDLTNKPWGLLSLCDASLNNRRAEVLVGMHPDAPLGLSVSAMLMLFEFYFKFMKFNKLTCFIYTDNPLSLKSTLHLGFEVEGQLKSHNFDPEEGKFMDVIQLGLSKQAAFSDRNHRLCKKLLVTRSSTEIK